MARRTKDEAEQTYEKIVKAALLLFSQNGVHQTTLEQIAIASNVTRGAIYWHFANKNEILKAIGEYVSTVLKARINIAIEDLKLTNPLQYLELYLKKILCEIITDKEMYQAFAILNCKCEYIENYKAILDRMIFCYNEQTELFTAIYNSAIDNNTIKAGLNPVDLASDTYAFLTGLIRLILIERYNNIKDIEKIVTTHIRLRSNKSV